VCRYPRHATILNEITFIVCPSCLIFCFRFFLVLLTANYSPCTPFFAEGLCFFSTPSVSCPSLALSISLVFQQLMKYDSVYLLVFPTLALICHSCLSFYHPSRRVQAGDTIPTRTLYSLSIAPNVSALCYRLFASGPPNPGFCLEVNRPFSLHRSPDARPPALPHGPLT